MIQQVHVAWDAVMPSYGASGLQSGHVMTYVEYYVGAGQLLIGREYLDFCSLVLFAKSQVHEEADGGRISGTDLFPPSSLLDRPNRHVLLCITTQILPLSHHSSISHPASSNISPQPTTFIYLAAKQ
jgi:hypothetical protein